MAYNCDLTIDPSINGTDDQSGINSILNSPMPNDARNYPQAYAGLENFQKEFFDYKKDLALRAKPPYTFAGIADNPLLMPGVIEPINLPPPSTTAFNVNDELHTVKITSLVKRFTEIMPGLRSVEERTRTHYLEQIHDPVIAPPNNDNPSIDLVLRGNNQDHNISLNFDPQSRSMRISSNNNAINLTTGNTSVPLNPNDTVDVDTSTGTVTFDQSSSVNEYSGSTTPRRRDQFKRGPRSRSENRAGPQNAAARRLQYSNQPSSQVNQTLSRSQGDITVHPVMEGIPIICFQNDKIVHISYQMDGQSTINETSSQPQYSQFNPMMQSSKNLNRTPQTFSDFDPCLQSNLIPQSSIAVDRLFDVETYTNSGLETVDLSQESCAPAINNATYYPPVINDETYCPPVRNDATYCEPVQNDASYYPPTQNDSTYYATNQNDVTSCQPAQNATYNASNRSQNSTSRQQSPDAPPCSDQFNPLFSSSHLPRQNYDSLFSPSETVMSNFDDMQFSTGSALLLSSSCPESSYEDSTRSKFEVSANVYDMSPERSNRTTSPESFRAQNSKRYITPPRQPVCPPNQTFNQSRSPARNPPMVQQQRAVSPVQNRNQTINCPPQSSMQNQSTQIPNSITCPPAMRSMAWSPSSPHRQAQTSAQRSCVHPHDNSGTVCSGATRSPPSQEAYLTDCSEPAEEAFEALCQDAQSRSRRS